ncbi:MAG: hypothetical protein N5P05_002643 [Chroococcopsis gigantea SAG 12.99]|jgi:hypothetical protein|nr:hypothetical protein [Chlorogloea purpurea SAG 13.99]MDV3001037.1 hypothetical protein [Chroococcopsis gigantea SAG 12.99]
MAILKEEELLVLHFVQDWFNFWQHSRETLSSSRQLLMLKLKRIVRATEEILWTG